MNSLPLWIVLSPLSGAVLLSLLAYTRARPWVGNLSPLGVLPPLLFVAVLLPRVMQDGQVVYIPGAWSALKGIPLVVDGLSIIMAGLGSGLGLLVLLYAIGERSYEPRYYALVLLLITGMLSVFLSGDLFNIYVGMEILSIASYILIAYHKGQRALLASITYLIISSMGLTLFLIGIAMLYQMTGTLNVHRIAANLPQQVTAHPARIALCAVFLLPNACIKAAIVPVHTWLADAHSEAPTPVSALLSGIMIKVGIYLIIRIAGLFNLPSIHVLLLWTGALTALVGAIVALCQNDMKRILAHSSISQIGYIALAFGAGTRLSVVGALYHLINHAFFKSLLFLSVGAVAHQTGSRDVRQLRGLGRQMPFIALTCTVGALSISGIPPFNGYMSKALIMDALTHHPIPAFLLTLSGLGTIASFTKLTRIFYGAGPPLHHKRVSPWMNAPMLILMLCCVTLGLAPNASVLFLSRLMHVGPIETIQFWSIKKGGHTLLSIALGLLLYHVVIHKVPHWAHAIRNVRMAVDLKLMVLIAYVISMAILFRVLL